MNIKKLSNVVGMGSMALLAMVGLRLVWPIMRVEANATDIQPFSAETNTKTSAYVRSSIAVSITSSATIDLTPLSAGSFSESSDVNLSVSTNNTTGYELYLTTGDNSSSLLLRSGKDEASINPVEGILTAANYQEHLDTWGYNFSSENDIVTSTNANEYVALPKNGEASVVKTDQITSNDNYVLKFGASASTNLPAGVYSNTVIASVVANPIEVRSLSDITTMQEMSNNICTISLENETNRLTDTRDGKIYWVTKLKDGRCWMTQNLALDIIVNGDGTSNIKASDSNVVEDWATSSDYSPISTMQFATSVATETDANGTLSLNPGLWVVATPMKAQSANNITNVSALPSVGLVDVSDTNKFQPIYTASIGDWTYANGSITESTLVAVNCTAWQDNICQAGTYDAHYLLGNYYQFNAVTAGAGATAKFNSVVSQSICPKGWMLPNIDGSAGDAGLLYLLGRYNITNKVVGVSSIDDRIYSVFEEPLAFPYGGRFIFTDNMLNDVGRIGYYGTKRIFGMVTNAAILMFTPDVLEMNNAPRTPGYNVRCVNDPRI